VTISRLARILWTLALLAALVLTGTAARANDGGYTWGMSISPTPTQQSADVITAGTAEDYGHTGPLWVYVTPWVHVWDPNWAGPSCSTTRYRNGVEQDSQHIGAGAPPPYVWSLNMTAPVTWRIEVTCPLPQGATGTPTIDVTFASELPPAPPSPVASAAAPVAPVPARVVAAKPAISGTPVAPPRPAPAATAPATASPPPVPSPQPPSPAGTPVVAIGTPPPSSPSPQPSVSPAHPTAPEFDAAPTTRRASDTLGSGRGFHLTFLWLLGLGLIVIAFLAARWHWGWR